MNYQQALGKACTVAMTRSKSDHDQHERGLDDVVLVIHFNSAGKPDRDSFDASFHAVTKRERQNDQLAPHTVWAVVRLVSFVGFGNDSRSMIEVTQEAEGRELK